MFGNLKFALFYRHTNAKNNKHLRANLYLEKVGGLRLLHSTVLYLQDTIHRCKSLIPV